jgi:DNA-binding NarL/FixJ family response regulator
MSENLRYKLCGYIDLALVETGFVIPIFKSNDHYYIEIHFNDIVTDFVLMPDDYLPLFTDDPANAGHEVATGDFCCYAFKWHESVYYGNSKDMMIVFHELLTGKIVPYYTERNMRSFIRKFGSKTSKPITLLIVDDHTLIRESWSYILGQMPNYQVVAEAGDGLEATELAGKEKPDIVLLDINMSPINGFEALKLIRKKTPKSKTIAVSMHSQPAYAKKILQLGGVGYVTKNSPKQEMFMAINQVYSGSKFICEEIKRNIVELMAEKDNSVQGVNSLTEREMLVINLIREGLSSKEMADKLTTSIKTIEVHRHNILKKLKLKNTVSLIDFANSMVANA